MGLLTEGSPLSWEDTKKLTKHVREHGIKQFINLYARLKDRQGDGNFNYGLILKINLLTLMHI